MKIGFLGPRGTFSFEVISHEYDEKQKLVEYKTIKDIIVGLENGEIHEGIVPIENSLQGGVTESIDSLAEITGIFIKKEVILKINQNLMAIGITGLTK